MLDVEAALVQVSARLGLVPANAVASIVSHCEVSAYDLEALHLSARSAGNLVIPLVSALTRNVAATDTDASRFVHW